MLVAGEVKGELARIHPARTCCRRAELAGLLLTADEAGRLSTLDRATARTAVHLAASLGAPVTPPRATAPGRAGARGARHHLRVQLDPAVTSDWRWEPAPSCDRRAFVRGALLGSGSISFGAGGPHVEFVFATEAAARALALHLDELGVRALRSVRRGRHIVYLKGHEEIAALLRLSGANRGLLELETARVGSEVRSRLNRLLNAEQANVDRTVRAADRQLRAIERLSAEGVLEHLSRPLREAVDARRRHPDADLDTLSVALGVSRSAVNHRLRRLVELAEGLDREE
jgi:DNA-binding protein WhiA